MEASGHSVGGVSRAAEAYPYPLPPLRGHELAFNSWSDDEIFASTHTTTGPRPPYTVGIWDIRLRRWYNVISFHKPPQGCHALEDSYWTEILKLTHHRGRDDFNCITVDPTDDSLTLSYAPLHKFAMALYDLFPPPPAPPGTSIPHIQIGALDNRRFLGGPTDLCSWEGHQVVFKQLLEGETGAKRFLHEINTLNHLRDSPRFLPILAYVVDEEKRTRGIILPYGGVTIDNVPHVKWQYFTAIMEGLVDLETIGSTHGDVFARNILLKDDKVCLIDPGNEGLDYPGDRQALVDLMSEMRRKALTKIDQDMINRICAMINEGEHFRQVLKQLPK